MHLIYFVSFDYRDVAGLSATILSSLPAGSGLGSSAAYSVCLAAGFLSSCGMIPATSDTTDSHGDIQKDMRERMMEAGVQITGRCASSGGGWSKDDMETINGWGFEGEKLGHGTPSGIDNTISTYGKGYCQH